MHGDLEPEEHIWENKVNDLYEDMERLNALYEELMWAHDVELEFTADYENNRIIIQVKNDELKRPAL
jgi:hypothetical protein|tara:strand:- start:357 stop:557 length:201 start_codon:yes stop_codon:yes gene_type:complete